MFTTYGLHGSKPYISYDLDAVIYTDIKETLCIATNESIFDFWTEYAYAEREGISLLQVPIGYRYSIDNIEVTEQTFNDVRRLLSERNLVKKYESVRKKENEDMPKIVDYTYIEHDKVTKIKWSDGSTTVVCGSGDDATQFCGFVCAIAKKAMGNNGKMLAEWDRLVVKPVERAKKAEEKKRLAAEKKAEEERIREEAKAKRMAKNAKYYEEREKRRKQREVEALAEQIVKEYEQDKLYAEAMKLAIEKYKVPCNYFDDDCDCHCNCKEFDVMDEDENNISD